MTYSKPKIIESLPRLALKGEQVAIDIEMFHQEKERLHRPHGDFACISIKYKDDDCVYQVYDPVLIPEVFIRISQGDWTLVNALYDLRQLRRWDTHNFLSHERPIYDCMLAEQNLFGGYYHDFSMYDMVRRYYSILISKSERENFHSADRMTDEMKQYAADDVVWTLAIRKAQEELKRDMTSYWELDAPMIWVLLDIQPVKVDVAKWRSTIEGFKEKAIEMEEALGFNSKSVPQTRAALLKEGIKVNSTAKEVLASIQHKSKIANQILWTRKYRDVCSKYGENWLKNSVEEGDLVWANFNINGALTGRMSSSHPNLQNIPRKDFPIYREFFIPQHDVMLSPDVSQQEPRILAFLSGDPNLLKVVTSDVSAHVQVARLIYNDPTIVKDGKDPRYAVGKAINLAIGYGLTATGLAEQTGLSEEESQKIIDIYFKNFPAIKYYMTKYRAQANRDGFITTVAGRRIYVNPYDFKSENNAINSPIQGGAADFTKKWAIAVHRMSKERGVPFSICIMVHDELVLDVRKEDVEATTAIIMEAMQIASSIYPGIPFTSDLNSGPSWASHE